MGGGGGSCLRTLGEVRMELARIPFSLEPHATLRGLEARSGPRGLLEAGEPLQEQEKPGKGRNQRRWRDPGQRTCRRGRGMVGGAGVGVGAAEAC